MQTALEHMGCTGVGEVRVGKYIEIEMDGDADTVKAKLSGTPISFLPTRTSKITGSSSRTDEVCRLRFQVQLY